VAGDLRDYDLLLGPTKASAWLHEVSCPSAGPQTGQFGRSKAEAKLHRLGLDPDRERP
jgi:hypothetical protein